MAKVELAKTATANKKAASVSGGRVGDEDISIVARDGKGWDEAVMTAAATPRPDAVLYVCSIMAAN
jgi:hypothetical protein